MLCLLTSCANEDFSSGTGTPGTAGDNIRFGISSGAGTRSADGGYEADGFVLRSADSTDTLCVRATVADGIAAPSSRAAKVTEENFYETFHVLAYRTINGVLQSSFYMDEDVRKESSGNLWSSDVDYYWPGTDTEQLQFLAWAPSDAFPQQPENSDSKLLAGYTVPQNVADQKDIVIAMTEPIGGAEGNTGAAVPLTFKHVCTAVRFAVGKEMQMGTIKSVTLRGVKSKGSYDMASGEWTLDNTVSDFSQVLDKEVYGTIGEGQPVTTEEQTFMMLPQTLSEGAGLEIEFLDKSGKTKIFGASIAGQEWQINTTVTYSISITPEYEFILTESPKLDAHYEILNTTLKVSGVPDDKEWTITAPTLNGEDVSIILQSELNQYAKNGYWTNKYKKNQDDNGTSARGEKTFTRTGSIELPIAIFVPENSGNAERTIDLTVNIDGTDYTTISLTQYAPSWNGSIGCERIEENPSPWGMYWSDDYSITYDLTKCSDDNRIRFHLYLVWVKLLKWIFPEGNIPDLYFVDETTPAFSIRTKTVTIKLGELDASDIALSPSNGMKNTLEIYNFKGFSVVIDLINRLENIPGHTVTTTGDGVNPKINASLECMKLNSCDIVEIEDNGNKQQLIQFETIKWYLPAQEEAPYMHDDEHPLSGTYWTSTAFDDNQNAYVWTISQTGMDLRKEPHNVRAVRQKP